MTKVGKNLDATLAKTNYKAARDLKPEHVKRVGTQGTYKVPEDSYLLKMGYKEGDVVERGIYEVTYPDGTTQRFWRSTGTGGKTVKLADGTDVNSEGFFGTIIGHAKVEKGIVGEIGSKTRTEGINGWFVKGENWFGYGSTTFKDTGAVLKDFFDTGLIK